MADIKWIENKTRNNTNRITEMEKEIIETKTILQRKENEIHSLEKKINNLNEKIEENITQLEEKKLKEKINEMITDQRKKLSKKIYEDVLDDVVITIRKLLKKELDETASLIKDVHIAMNNMTDRINENETFTGLSIARLLTSLQKVFPDKIDNKKIDEITKFVVPEIKHKMRG